MISSAPLKEDLEIDLKKQIYELECRINLLEHAARCERSNYIHLRDELQKLVPYYL